MGFGPRGKGEAPGDETLGVSCCGCEPRPDAFGVIGVFCLPVLLEIKPRTT